MAPQATVLEYNLKSLPWRAYGLQTDGQNTGRESQSDRPKAVQQGSGRAKKSGGSLVTGLPFSPLQRPGSLRVAVCVPHVGKHGGHSVWMLEEGVSRVGAEVFTQTCHSVASSPTTGVRPPLGWGTAAV